MFDLMTVVLLGGTTMFLGRSEILLVSRFVGKGVGMLVGTIQGVRTKFEEHSKHSELGQLRESVKKGIRDVSSIGTDILHAGNSSFSPSQPSPTYPRVHGLSVDTSRTASPASSPPNFPLTNQGINVSAAYNGDLDENTQRLSRLILAEEKLAASTHPTRTTGGASIIQQAISTSILNSYYAASLQTSGRPGPVAQSPAKQANND